MSDRLSSDKTPDVLVERAEFPLNLQQLFCIRYRRSYLQTVADDARIPEEALYLPFSISRHYRWVEVVEGPEVVLTLLKDGLPAQASLRAVEDQIFE